MTVLVACGRPEERELEGCEAEWSGGALDVTGALRLCFRALGIESDS